MKESEKLFCGIPCVNCILLPKCISLFNTCNKAVYTLISDKILSTRPIEEKWLFIKEAVFVFTLCKNCKIFERYVSFDSFSRNTTKFYFLSICNDRFKQLLTEELIIHGF